MTGRKKHKQGHSRLIKCKEMLKCEFHLLLLCLKYFHEPGNDSLYKSEVSVLFTGTGLIVLLMNQSGLNVLADSDTEKPSFYYSKGPDDVFLIFPLHPGKANHG